jgi:hypothetical protein
VGLLVPSGIATDNTTKDFFGELISNDSLTGLYDFENKAPIFPDVHRSYKFCVLLFGGSNCKSAQADFVFFAHQMEDLRERDRHISLSRDDFKRLNPNTLTCPVFRSRRDAEITKAIYRCVPVLVDKTRHEGGNPWGIRFVRMFDQTNDAELFRTARQLEEAGFKRDGPLWKKRKQVFLPLYEAKMVQMYDHRAASVVVDEANWMRQGQTDATTLVQHQNPEYTVKPRWWVEADHVSETLGAAVRPAYIAYKDVTSPTNTRTMIAALIPHVAVLNSAPLILTDGRITETQQGCLLGNLNSVVLDFVARQKVGGLHLNFFIVEQLPAFAPDFYQRRCAWSKREKLAKWIADRVLKLTCVSHDMKPLAEAAKFKPLIHKWDPGERAELQAELDAAFFLLYGVRREDMEYILSTFNGIRKESEGALPGTTTRERILACYDRFWEAAATS